MSNTAANDFMLMPEVSGHRDANEPLALPDMRLTADEFLHWQAVTQEAIPGCPLAHTSPPPHVIVLGEYLRGFPKPGCAACESIMAKAEALLAEAERLGLAPWVSV